MAARRSSGSSSRCRSRSRAIASAVTTPQPPAVVSTTTFGPARRRLGGERGRGLERLLHRRRPGDPGGPARAVEHRVVGGERAGVAGRGPRAAGGGAALHEHQRLGRGRRGERVEQRRAVVDALEVGQTDVGRVVVGVEVEVVGHRHGGGVAGRDRPRRSPTPVARARFRKLDTKLPLWLATPMRPAGGYGATIWAHSDTGVLTRP